jgi:hypothetical protein
MKIGKTTVTVSRVLLFGHHWVFWDEFLRRPTVPDTQRLLAKAEKREYFELIMRACIILHTMIIDNERDDNYNDNYHTVIYVVAPHVTYEAPTSLTTIL